MANKPKLVSFLVCDDVLTDENSKKNSLIGIFTRINTKKFPSTHPRMVVFMAWLNNKSGEKSKLDIKIVAPNREVLKAKIEGHEIEFKADKVGIYGVFNFNNVVFKEPGVYSIKAFLDKEKIAELPLEVKRILN